MFDSIKNIILWNYPRGTWQYDLLCGLIILFIFITPKNWFEKADLPATQATRVYVKASDISRDQAEMQKRVREISGKPDAEIIDLHEKKDANGETFYEIDIR
jgi:hypothetical protein